MVEPTRPDIIRMLVMVRKFIDSETTGLINAHIGMTIAASTIAVKIKNMNSKKT